MIPLIVAALSTEREPALSRIRLTHGVVVEARWVPGHYPGKSGSVTVAVLDGRRRREERVPLPPDAWPEADAAARPVAMLSPDVRPDRAVLDLTLPIESGVYGYRRATAYLVAPSRKGLLARLGKPVEFSDFGSWRRRGPREIEYWDADLGEPVAHMAPHHYRWTRLIQTASGNRIVRRRSTKGTYGFNWEREPDGPAATPPPRADPLRELGSAWTWWGDPSGGRRSQPR